MPLALPGGQLADFERDHETAVSHEQGHETCADLERTYAERETGRSYADSPFENAGTDADYADLAPVTGDNDNA
jgi:hypothetical protein